MTKKSKNIKNGKKIEGKEENKIKKFFKDVLIKIKNFFNHPAPLIIALIVLNFISLLYISRYDSHNQIFVGNISKTVSVGSIHFFTNNDINYFYASSATLLEEDQDVYNYEIGYYVKKGEDMVPFATRSGVLDKKTKLSELVLEFSGWEIAEPYTTEYFFKPDIIDNMSDLYFIINASKEKGSTKADVHYEISVDNNKVTK